MARARPVRFVVVPAVAGLLVWFISRKPEPAPVEAGQTPAVPTASAEPPDPGPLPGAALVAGYGDPSTEPIEDILGLHRLLGGYFSIIKDHGHHPIGGNEDLAAALLGKNADRQPFLTEDHPAVGADGRLVDRWGTPLFVHPEAARAIGIRSAGPDRVMFTDDDLAVTPDGTKE